MQCLRQVWSRQLRMLSKTVLQRQKENGDPPSIWCDHPSSRDACTQPLRAGRLNTAPDCTSNPGHASAQLHGPDLAAAGCECETRAAAEGGWRAAPHWLCAGSSEAWWRLLVGPVSMSAVWLFGCNSSMETHSRCVCVCVCVTLVDASCELEVLLIFSFSSAEVPHHTPDNSPTIKGTYKN